MAALLTVRKRTSAFQLGNARVDWDASAKRSIVTGHWRIPRRTKAGSPTLEYQMYACCSLPGFFHWAPLTRGGCQVPCQCPTCLFLQTLPQKGNRLVKPMLMFSLLFLMISSATIFSCHFACNGFDSPQDISIQRCWGYSRYPRA